MDALFDSINVRELLSAQDLSDPTTPLSAPDLLLPPLSSPRLPHLFSLCNDAVSRSHLISDDVVRRLASISSNRPVEAEIADTLKQMTAATKEFRAKRELLELVRTIVELSEKLKAARDALRNGRLRFAAEELRELKEALRVSDEDDRLDESEPVVYGC